MNCFIDQSNFTYLCESTKIKFEKSIPLKKLEGEQIICQTQLKQANQISSSPVYTVHNSRRLPLGGQHLTNIINLRQACAVMFS